MRPCSVPAIGVGTPSVRPPSGADVEFAFSAVPLVVITINLTAPGVLDPIAAAANASAIIAGPDNTIDWAHIGNGQLQYRGAAPRLFLITGSITGTNPATDDEFDVLAIGIGNTPGNPANGILTSGNGATFVGSDQIPNFVTSITARIVRVVRPAQIVELFMGGDDLLNILSLQLTVTAVA